MPPTTIRGWLEYIINQVLAFFAGVPAAITAINTKLDALATLSADVAILKTTLADVPSYLDAMYFSLLSTQGNIAIAKDLLVSIDGTLDLVNARDALGFELLTTIRQTIGDTSGIGTSTLVISQRNIVDLLELYNSNFGGANSGQPLSALQLLNLISQNTGCGCASGPPSALDGQGCTDPYVSDLSGIGAQAEGGALPPVYARFQTALPSGISYGSGDTLAPPNAELAFTNPAGWRYYVDSDALSHRRSATSATLYPNRQWLTLPASPTSLVWIVEQPYTLTVYLCPPTDTLPSVCTEYTANQQVSGKWAFNVPELPSNWTVQANDNWYVLDGLGNQLAGPFSANTPIVESALPPTPHTMRFGRGTNEVAPVIELCPPA